MAEENEIREAKERLTGAGMDPGFLEAMFAEGGAKTAELVLSWNNTQLTDVASQHPSPNLSAYRSAEMSLGFTGTSATAPPPGMGQGAFSYVAPKDGYEVDPTSGALRYTNGVIVDVESNDVLFPPNDPDVAGSPAWLRKIQESWSAEKIDKWREKLANWGYIESAEGGMAADLMDGLADFHRVRYINGGKAIPASAAPGPPTVSETYDDVYIDQDIRETFVENLGYEPNDEELKRFRQRYKRGIRRALKKGKAPETAVARGQAAFAEDFTEDPAISAISDANEERGEVADAFLNAFQAIDMLA